MKNKKRWVQKCDTDDLNLPIPTQIVSNEEFAPPDQTPEQRRVEHRLIEIASDSSRRLGISRRAFLASTGGMAAAFLAMNGVFGQFFDVDEAELFEPRIQRKVPEDALHLRYSYTSRRRPKDHPKPAAYTGYRDAGAAWGNEIHKGREHKKWEDLYLANYIKEMFLDSDTSMAVSRACPPGPMTKNQLTPAEMIETRAEIKGLAKSKRIVAHGLFSPDMGKSDLEAMQRQHERLKVEAWKGYPGQPLADGSVGWWMDDEKIAYPSYE